MHEELFTAYVPTASKPAHAECHGKEAVRHLILPAAILTVPFNAPVGTTLRSVRVAADSDMHFS